METIDRAHPAPTTMMMSTPANRLFCFFFFAETIFINLKLIANDTAADADDD